MTEDECRRLLRSEAPVVGVEAAAGCGKTYEAASLASDLAVGVGEHQEVLLLAHTHAAIGVFRERLGRRRRVRVMTLDSFAHELVEPYAHALKLPTPLRPGRAGGVRFEQLAPALNELFERSVDIRKSVAGHYPVVLLDEHQDARGAQHELAIALARSGSRVRFFGDPMQGIFDFGESAAAPWATLARDANEIARLLSPRRWPSAPRLGAWLTETRSNLMACGALPRLIPEVRIANVEDDEPFPKSRRPPNRVANAILRLLDTLDGTVGVLVRNRDHAVGLRRGLKRRLPIFEGRSAVEKAHPLLVEAFAASGNARALALLAVDVLGRFSAGVTSAVRAQLARCLLTDRIDLRKQTKLRPFLTMLEVLYAAPTTATWCKVVGALVSKPPEGVHLDDAGALRALGRLGETGEDALEDALAELGTRIAHVRPRRRCITTIHMAKGDEFDHVIVPHFGASSFPANDAGRKLLYVAATRAKRSLLLLAPQASPSPLRPA